MKNTPFIRKASHLHLSKVRITACCLRSIKACLGQKTIRGKGPFVTPTDEVSVGGVDSFRQSLLAERANTGNSLLFIPKSGFRSMQRYSRLFYRERWLPRWASNLFEKGRIAFLDFQENAGFRFLRVSELISRFKTTWSKPSREAAEKRSFGCRQEGKYANHGMNVADVPIIKSPRTGGFSFMRIKRVLSYG